MHKDTTKFSGYKFTKAWFEYVQNNPHKVKSYHVALYMWFIELNNQMSWAEKFSAPTNYCMISSGIRHHKTYRKAFDDLVSWGFINVIQPSVNQYTACVISLNCSAINDEAINKCPGINDTPSTKASTQASAPYTNLKPKTFKQEGDKKSPDFKKEVFNLFKKIFLDEFKSITDTEYYFTAKDGTHLKQLVEKVKFSIGADATEKQMTDDFKNILKNHGNKWLNSNFSIAKFNSQYNEIISGIKNKTAKADEFVGENEKSIHDE